MLEFETDGNALWISKDSPYLANSNWLKENFDNTKPLRINSLIIEGRLYHTIDLSVLLYRINSCVKEYSIIFSSFRYWRKQEYPDTRSYQAYDQNSQHHQPNQPRKRDL